MKYFNAILLGYMLMAIVTFGHASDHFMKEREATCDLVKRLHPQNSCWSFEFDYRPEAMLFSLLWPYYWSERLWEAPIDYPSIKLK